MMGMACVPASDVGEGMLPKYGLTVDRGNRPGVQIAEVGLACDDEILPRVVVVVCFAVMENVHCRIDL